ncbi:D-alanyl-D-alanine carboxypeptidase [Candidatus Atelocyanobacterium thalassae]|nr:D-alanyl-D-alanine carboxypeptidase [Candidatus Atelocyanobacterium thalassa]MCH2542976.1 D-alanyl-D-alanine carboxypeptidase [Candidatus Atelocyanobacterium sp. ALOHA_A2.5_9]|tara:strand:+ start:52959 stop:53849 length:891 start_codon:yes stop_codon:yes gene_type:complete
MMMPNFFLSYQKAILVITFVLWANNSFASELMFSIKQPSLYNNLESTQPHKNSFSRVDSKSCKFLIHKELDNIILSHQKHWGILVEKLEDGTVLYSHNPDKYFIPASNNKIFTTAAALQLFNPKSKIGSKTLESWVNITNTKSNNYYADTLLRYIDGQETAKKALVQLGVTSNSFRQIDGSGLSRRNIATPRSLVTVLRAMYYTSAKQYFYTSLPVAGLTGTLRNRMKSTSAQGYVYAKTGTLRNVRALSGYIDHSYLGMIVFSILANNSNISGPNLIKEIDRMIVQLSKVGVCDY